MFLYMYQNQQKGQRITVYHLLLRFSPNLFFVHPREFILQQTAQQPERPTLLFSIEINLKKHVSESEYNRHAPWPLMRKFLFSRFYLVTLFRRLVKRQSQAIGSNKGHSASPSNNKPITQ